MATTHLPDLITLTPPDGASPLYLDRMDVRGTVAGNNCLTEIILTFKNDTNRTLEGELNFPLPQSGVVSGFGYEIDGNMVDGIIVEKEVARVAFEKEVRSGGKAALVEHVAGNAFKTRVYPIHPNRPISVKVVYLSDVEVNSDGSSYSLPLCITKPLSSLSLHLEIRGTTPVVRDADEAFAGLKFTATGNDFVSDVQLEQFKSKKNLLIGLGAPRQEEASSLSNTFDGECYFLVHDVPAESHETPSAEKDAPINHVAVVWDSSLSMETVSKKRVLKVLGDLYADDALKNAKTSLIQFRQVTEKLQPCANAQELLTLLNQVEYDGGTDLANLRWLGGDAPCKRTCGKGHDLTFQKPSYPAAKGLWDCDGCQFAKSQDGEAYHCEACGYDLCSVCFSEPPSGLVNTPYDRIILVTDGFSNLSDDIPLQTPTSPVYVLNIGTQCNALPLQYICNKTGGQFLDLTRIAEDAHVVRAITSSSKFSFLNATFNATEFTDVLPSQPVAILPGEKFTCAGKLLRGSGTITLNYGRGGKVVASRQVTVSNNKSENSLVAKIWAGMKVKELSVFAEQNKQQLLDVGRKYGIVTPGASILVLSTLDAYLKHGIEPNAKALPKVHKEYTSQLASKKKAEDQKIKAKINTVVGWWTNRKQWYEKDFSSVLRSQYREAWEQTMRQENPRLFEYSSAPPPLPPLPGAHTARMNAEQADAWVRDHPPAISVPVDDEVEKRRESRKAEAPMKKKAMKEKMDERPSLSAACAPPSMSAPPHPIALLDSEPDCKMAKCDDECEEAPMALDCAALPPPPAMISAPAPAPMAFGDAAAPPRASALSRPGAAAPAPAPAPAPALFASSASGGGGAAGAAAADPDDDGQTASGIAIKAWTPDMPYLNAIKAQAKTEQYAAYLKQRQSYRSSPAFYLDVATYFFSENELKQYGHRVLTSIADLGLEDPGLLRIVGYKLSNEGLLRQAAAVFGRVLRLREKEPQSWRDLGNVLADLGLYKRALELFNKVIIGEWDSNYSEIELTVLMEANRVIDIVNRKKLKVAHEIDPQLVYNMPCDLRISCGWDTNDTDVDLHVREPDGTECYYSNNRTPTGGLVSRDFTRGYGPEEYMIKFGLPGKYIIKVRYYASHAQNLSGGTTILLNVFTDYARGEYERCQKTTVRLQQQCDNFEVAQIDFAPSGPRKANLRDLEEQYTKEMEERAGWVEAWEAYNAREQEIAQWNSEEQFIKTANNALISDAEQRWLQNPAAATPTPAAPRSGGSSPRRSASPAKGDSDKGLGAKIMGLFKR